MKVKNIEIKNYKGFEHCLINFDPKINVFIGSNASGKTTLLNAITKSIYDLTSSFAISRGSRSDLKFSEDDINYKSKFSIIKTELSEFPDYNHNIQVQIEKGILDKITLDRQKLFNKQQAEFRIWFREKLKTSIPEIPIIKFYPANRGAISYTGGLRDNVYESSQLEAWANIYQDSLSYSVFFNWYFENETAELRLQRDSNNFNTKNPKLEGVRTALYRAFEQLNFGSYELVSEQIEREGSSKLIPSLSLKNKISGQKEILNNLSEGQKAIITLIADIAYNLSLANNFDETNEFLNSKGIILIDEIETHLHPKWQREIIPILIEVFPNLQFFIATHSPQIISSVKSENVFICDDFNVSRVALKTKGEDTNSLLKYIFDVTERPKPYIALINKFDTLIENNADENELLDVISDVKKLYNQDSSNAISNLIEELNIKLSAYQFEKEYDKNN